MTTAVLTAPVPAAPRTGRRAWRRHLPVRRARSVIDPKVALLASLGLFDGVPVRLLKSVAPLVEHLDLPCGSQLLREGAVSREALLLVAGTARASLRGQVLGSAGPGQFLGDLALLRSERSPLTWTATTDVLVLSAGPRELRELLYRCPIVADRLHELEPVPPNRNRPAA